MTLRLFIRRMIQASTANFRSSSRAARVLARSSRVVSPDFITDVTEAFARSNGLGRGHGISGTAAAAAILKGFAGYRLRALETKRAGIHDSVGIECSLDGHGELRGLRP